MLKFNNNNIFTGYLKQLLASTPISNYKVYTKNLKENQIIRSELDTDSTTNLYFPYLKDDRLQIYTKDKITGKNIWKDLDTVTVPNKKILNNTRQLKIKNNIYDSYTHEYLGDFLRFVRDFYKVDLMSLYNCFSNNYCNNLNIEINSNNNKITTFNTADNAYKIYMLPVKLFSQYTIAIDCEAPYEICCGLYNIYQLQSDSKNLSDLTYIKINNSKFNQPFLYSKLENLSISNSLALATNEKYLKMFIKLPISCESSITILEGDFTAYGRTANHYITNYANPESFNNFKPISRLQLLDYNTKISHPFADRLIEYLTENAITDQDLYTDNIKRVQAVLAKNNIYSKIPGIWSKNIRPIIYDSFFSSLHIKNNQNTNSLQSLTLLNNTESTVMDNKLTQSYSAVPQLACHDILGYIDKDAEKYYTGGTGSDKVSLETVDIYPDMYKDVKKNGGNN